jgi:hypothetical protein
MADIEKIQGEEILRLLNEALQDKTVLKWTANREESSTVWKRRPEPDFLFNSTVLFMNFW